MIRFYDSGFSISPGVMMKIFCFLLFGIMMLMGVYMMLSVEKNYLISTVMFITAIGCLLSGTSNVMVTLNDTHITIIKTWLFPYYSTSMEIIKTEVIIREVIANGAGMSGGKLYEIRFKDGNQDIEITSWSNREKAEIIKDQIKNVLNRKTNYQ